LVDPPATTVAAPVDHSAMASGGSTTTTPSPAPAAVSHATSTTGRPANAANCLGAPKRRPEPPATTIVHTEPSPTARSRASPASVYVTGRQDTDSRASIDGRSTLGRAMAIDPRPVDVRAV